MSTSLRDLMAEESSLYRDVISCSPNAVIGVDLDGYLLFWNPAAERIFGWTSAEVVGSRLPFVPEGHWSEFEASIARVEAGETLVGVERIRRHRDGHDLHVRLSAAPFRDASGRVVGSLAFLEDITPQVDTVSHLLASERRFRQMFMSAAVGISVTEVDGRYREANPAFCRLLGYREEELRGRNFQSITYPEDLEETVLYHRRLIAGEIRSYVLEKRYVRKDGSLMWCRISVTLVRGPDDEPDYLVAVTEDVTKRREAEASLRRLNLELEKRISERTAELERINEELEAFTYSVSHDLRAPLRAIDGWAQAVIEDYEKVLDEPGRQMLQRQRAASQRLGCLIDDLLRLSRVTRQSFQRQSVDPSELVMRVWQEVAGNLDTRVSAVPQIGELPKCDADPELLEHVFSNLLSNAAKFSQHEPEPRIEIGSIPDEKDGVAYFVRDNGAGFDARYADKLFQPFQRLHSDREFLGTGVGLAIVQRVIHRHGGRIWAESEVGRGATFFFTIPPDATASP